ncbi:hypothetical protein Y032_0335g2855 [Ancylostoma ceylanicum]|uniref:Uncharacterized protein n=1 Tax=Ancylostoma ceylanicum TaxID=53326 RepID=A0A016RZB1_9BILA|nr:hypothetical protein Y032_0335g2855 [Ancylostoma ceylanicum]
MFVVLLLLSLTNLSFSDNYLRCWTWNYPHQLEEIQTLTRGGPKSPQCFFTMDIPCNMTAIQTSARMSITYHEDPHNSCSFMDEDIFCACNSENYCSSECKYVVKIWKESKVYKAGSEAAKCMAEYERACLNKEIVVGYVGSSKLLYGDRILHS